MERLRKFSDAMAHVSINYSIGKRYQLVSHVLCECARALGTACKKVSHETEAIAETEKMEDELGSVVVVVCILCLLLMVPFVYVTFRYNLSGLLCQTGAAEFLSVETPDACDFFIVEFATNPALRHPIYSYMATVEVTSEAQRVDVVDKVRASSSGSLLLLVNRSVLHSFSPDSGLDTHAVVRGLVQLVVDTHAHGVVLGDRQLREHDLPQVYMDAKDLSADIHPYHGLVRYDEYTGKRAALRILLADVSNMPHITFVFRASGISRTFTHPYYDNFYLKKLNQQNLSWIIDEDVTRPLMKFAGRKSVALSMSLMARSCPPNTIFNANSTSKCTDLPLNMTRVRAQIHIAPLPKNMSPVYHRARRDARARKLAKQYGTDPDTLYTDAARCGTHGFSLAAVGSVSRPGLFTCASARTNSANTAEALAVALAIKTKESLRQGSYFLTDSQIACRYFTSGRVPACVARALLGATLDQDHIIIWCPAHIEATGNARADGAARSITYRATVPRLDTRLIPQAPHTPGDILEHQRRQRRRYSTPHPRLNLCMVYPGYLQGNQWSIMTRRYNGGADYELTDDVFFETSETFSVKAYLMAKQVKRSGADPFMFILERYDFEPQREIYLNMTWQNASTLCLAEIFGFTTKTKAKLATL
ncbi:hypothetical protein HPB50_008939 [Hyalomma asiaticum]|uniref:Uncharacterized protein n=1 Tax=Hyalomma asiaticum TaxID=266040 RepID=A0ACB7SUT4_HYAAI|nr:hypothetical protein HPB50_008939 [Hyalomma asiaticum]